MRQFKIRVGINENNDNVITDINGSRNISGMGINYAARIEGLADQSQILVGNSVFEKLNSREVYMNSFKSYSTEVKHGIEMNVHHYRNKKLNFLNCDVPSRFQITPKKITRINTLQAYYIAICIVNEGFLIKNVGTGQQSYSLQVLMYQLALDYLYISKSTKMRPITSNTRAKREVQEQFKYIQSVDFYIICDLANNYMDNLDELIDCFDEEFLFVSEFGKKKLLEDQPKIYEELIINKSA